MNPNPNPQFNPKGTTDKHFNHHRLTPEQRRFVEETYHALVKIYSLKFGKANPYGYTARDIASYAIEKVLRDPAKFMKRTPQHAANAIAKNALQDFWRRQRAQRGQGARNTREVIGDEPVNPDDAGAGTVLDKVTDTIVDPEEWIEREHQQGVIRDVQSLMSPIAFDGFYLTQIEGLDQAEAAEVLGVTREYLNRQMRAATKKIQALATSYREWGVE